MQTSGLKRFSEGDPLKMIDDVVPLESFSAEIVR
jgi:hypothetical protein